MKENLIRLNGEYYLIDTSTSENEFLETKEDHWYTDKDTVWQHKGKTKTPFYHVIASTLELENVLLIDCGKLSTLLDENHKEQVHLKAKEEAIKNFPYDDNAGNVEDDIDAAKREIYILGYLDGYKYHPYFYADKYHVEYDMEKMVNISNFDGMEDIRQVGESFLFPKTYIKDGLEYITLNKITKL